MPFLPVVFITVTDRITVITALQYIQPSPLYMCTVVSSCLYRTTHYWNRSDYRCISLRPHTYVLWCQCQVKFRLGVTAFNNAGPNPLSYYSEEIKATMSSQSSYSSVQNRNVEKEPNQSCQSVIPFVMGDVSREDSTSLWWHRGWSLQLCSS